MEEGFPDTAEDPDEELDPSVVLVVRGLFWVRVLRRFSFRGGASPSAGLELELEKGWVSCVAAHSVFGVDGFDRLWSIVLASWRPVDERLILNMWVAVVVLLSRTREQTSRDFFLGDDIQSAELSFSSSDPCNLYCSAFVAR